MSEPVTRAPDFIADLPKTELLRLVVALSTEVYALADRMEQIWRSGLADAVPSAP